MKVYWWPFLYDECYWSVECVAVANSIEEARAILAEKLEVGLFPLVNRPELYRKTKDQVKEQLNKEPVVLDTNVVGCAFEETSR